MRLFDVASVAIAVILLVGLLALAVLEIDAPENLTDAFKISLGALLRSGAAVANDYRHRNGNT